MSRRILALALLAAIVALPELAAACAVCTGGQTDEVRYAFIWTTGFLSALPLGLIGGLIWFVRRRARELAERSLAPEAPPTRLAASRSSSSL